MNLLHTIEPHRGADLFPMMSAVELDELSQDIAEHGLLEPIAVLEGDDGAAELLDGRTRREAIRRIPDTARREELEKQAWDTRRRFRQEAGFDPYAFVISKNLRRRHLNVEERQNILIELIARQPQKSDRQIAKDIGVDHKTIGRARSKGVDVGRIPHVACRTDTKGRKQPALKPRAAHPVRVTKGSGASASLHRDTAILGFSTLLHNKLAETLDDLVRILADERGRIAALPLAKRIALARGFWNALAVRANDLQPIINGAPWGVVTGAPASTEAER